MKPDFNENWFIFNGLTPISSHAIDHAKENISNLLELINIYDYMILYIVVLLGYSQ
jgi:hypothetical protein